MAIVSAEYYEAVSQKNEARAGGLKSELVTFPPSIVKGTEFLRGTYQQSNCVEAVRHLGLSRQSGRSILQREIDRDHLAAAKEDRPFSLVWLLEQFAAPTEETILDSAVEVCEERLRNIIAGHANQLTVSEEQSLPLWHSIRSRVLTLRLRRILNTLVDSLAGCQSEDGYWDNGQGPDARITALMAVILQRLGNDSHRERAKKAVLWVCQNVSFEASFLTQKDDVVAVALGLEAVRRSGMLEQLRHIVDAGDKHLLGQQGPLGSWSASGWDDTEVTLLVLDYFAQAGTMLEQVDGFLLMARDFFRKAQELAYEGGVNNRRLSTIAAVHATEMFLYGLFEKREDLGISAYIDRGDQTLGPRESLAALQRRLQEEGLLASNRQLSYRDQLSGFVGHRDMVIHRASEISANELERGLRAVGGFIKKYGEDLLTLDLLQ